ncbi:MAG TPA: hypothetical protein VKP69_19925 [Isosphaeraceae bacterium]|nr:hypothetical protein [Isosphaeraceae bacterium]
MASAPVPIPPARGAHAIVAGHHARPEGWTKTPAWEPVERGGDVVALVVLALVVLQGEPLPRCSSLVPAPAPAPAPVGATSFQARAPNPLADAPRLGHDGGSKGPSSWEDTPMPDESDDEPFVLRAPAPQRRRGARRDEARMTRDQMRDWAAKACGPQNDWTPYCTIRTNALREHLSLRDLGRILDEVCEQAGFDLFRVRADDA